MLAVSSVWRPDRDPTRASGRIYAFGYCAYRTGLAALSRADNGDGKEVVMSDPGQEMITCPRCVRRDNGYGCNLCSLRRSVPVWVAVEHALIVDGDHGGFRSLELGVRWRDEK